jgi:hypothetical protein
MHTANHEPATPALAARARRDLLVGAQQARREIERERRLADAGRAHEQERPRRAAPDQRPDRGERGGVAPGPGTLHRRRQAVVLVFRVVRRFGAASAVPRHPPRLRSPRPVGRRGRLLARGGPTLRSRALGRVVSRGGGRRLARRAALRRRRRCLGAAGAASDDVAGAALRVVRRFGAGASAASVTSTLGSAPRAWASSTGRASSAGWVGGLVLICWRSIASNSGGTSLHGSADPDGRAASRGRSSARL